MCKRVCVLTRTPSGVPYQNVDNAGDVLTEERAEVPGHDFTERAIVFA